MRAAAYYSDQSDFGLDMYQVGLSSSNYALSRENVKAFIQSDAKFDLIVNEEFYHDSFLMFAHKFDAPVVEIST